MDPHRFDFAAVVRAIPDIVPRRTALGGLLTTGLMVLAPRLAPDVAVAKKRRKKKKRKKCKTCETCETGFSCGSGTKPCGTECIPSGDCCGGCGEQECCDGTCADLATDGENCGACGHACQENGCFNGACACLGLAQCPDGCFCLARREGGFGCAGSLVLGFECATDADCRFGSFCSGFACTIPCVA